MGSDNRQDSSVPPDVQDPDVEDFLKRPSSLPGIGMTVRGFAREEEAREIANVVLIFLREFGRFLGLERLEAVTIATDYDDALAQVKRGFGTGTVLTKTQDEFAVGVAMTPTVMRNGNEYIASRLSAGFGEIPERISYFESTFCLALESARKRGNAAIIAYRTQKGVTQLVSESADLPLRMRQQRE